MVALAAEAELELLEATCKQVEQEYLGKVLMAAAADTTEATSSHSAAVVVVAVVDPQERRVKALDFTVAELAEVV
jgi:hypothetical protein